MTTSPRSRSSPGLGGPLSRILGIPFVGKLLAILLFLPPLFIAGVFVFESPFSAELTTEGVVTGMRESGSLARYVYYEYEVEGKRYEGKMQWVDLKTNPHIREGATVKVYYNSEKPSSSRTEDEPTMLTMVVVVGLVWVALWAGLIVYARKRRGRKPA